MEGPRRAPSSPPETPVPMKRMPFSARPFVRRLVSVKRELPPSMMMSPFSRCGTMLIDHLVDRVAGLDHQHDAARRLERLNQLLDGMRADDLRALGFVLEELVDLGDGSIEDGHAVAVVVHVQDQILAHDSEADQSDVASCSWHSRFGRDRPEN